MSTQNQEENLLPAVAQTACADENLPAADATPAMYMPAYAPYPGNWKRTIATIFVGEAFSFLTSSMAGFAVVWYLTVTTGSAVVLSMSTLFAVLPQGLLSPFAGTIVDRFNRKHVMIIADIVIAFATLILAIAFLIFGEVPLWSIFALLIIRSSASAFQAPAFQAVTPHIVPEKHLVRISSIQMGISSFTYIGGPALGILAYETLGMQAALFSDVIGAALAIIALAIVFIPDVHLAAEERTGVLREMRDGWDELRRMKGIFALALFITIGTLFYFPIASLYPLMTATHFGGGGYEAALVEAMWGVGMVIGSVILGVWGGGTRLSRLICITFLFTGAICAVVGLLPPTGFVWFVVLDLIMAILAPFYNGPVIAILQKTIDPIKLGRVSSLIMCLFTIASPVGLLFAGPIAEAIGIPTWFAICGAAIALISLVALFWPSVRSLDRFLVERAAAEATAVASEDAATKDDAALQPDASAKQAFAAPSMPDGEV